MELIDFITVPTRDRTRALDWYRDVLGCPRAAVAAARAELEAKGVEFIAETWDLGVCHFAAFRDPDGNTLIPNRR